LQFEQLEGDFNNLEKECAEYKAAYSKSAEDKLHLNAVIDQLNVSMQRHKFDYEKQTLQLCKQLDTQTEYSSIIDFLEKNYEGNVHNMRKGKAKYVREKLDTFKRIDSGLGVLKRDRERESNGNTQSNKSNNKSLKNNRKRSNSSEKENKD